MQIKYRKINEIRPYSKNPRKISKGVDVVADSIEKYGFQQPIVVDSNNEIIVGHTRYQASKKLGLSEVPVLVANNLTEEQVKAYRIMDNKSGEKTDWDESLLIEELEELMTDTSLHELASDTGFSEAELNKWFSTTDVEGMILDANETPVRAKPGDIYTLGDHRIACGDSTDSNLIAQLLGTDKIELIWEDPPYGVSYKSPNAIKHGNEYAREWREEHSIENDNLNEEQINELLTNHMSAILPYWKPGGGIYWCHDIRFTYQFKQILTANNVHISDTLIWKKNTHSTFVSDYCKIYEPILYGWQKGAEHRWYAERMQRNAHTVNELEDMTREQLIKLIKQQHTNYQEFNKIPAQTASQWHPTVKPPKLIAYHIINSTKPNDIVYDGFSGSGSTLIACEKTSRVARCIEYKPKYIDVIITRWQDETGLKAVRQDGTLWDDIATVPEMEVSYG